MAIEQKRAANPISWRFSLSLCRYRHILRLSHINAAAVAKDCAEEPGEQMDIQ